MSSHIFIILQTVGKGVKIVHKTNRMYFCHKNVIFPEECQTRKIHVLEPGTRWLPSVLVPHPVLWAERTSLTREAAARTGPGHGQAPCPIPPP